jgi:hypothetical protein
MIGLTNIFRTFAPEFQCKPNAESLLYAEAKPGIAYFNRQFSALLTRELAFCRDFA